MPSYTYTDGTDEVIVSHSIKWHGEIYGGTGVLMWKKPPMNVGVNWNGLKPSEAEQQSPELKKHLDPNNLAAKRGEYERIHEEHEQREHRV